MKVLVTGATGFIGTWLTKKLLDLGHSVRILYRADNLPNPFDSNAVEVFNGDMSDVQSLTRATQGVQAVFHLAGLIAYSRAMRKEMYQTNVVGTENMIQACKKSSVQRLMYMSSTVAVGASFDGKNLLNEESEFNLHHLNLGYFETKLQAEKAVQKAARDGELDAVILNPTTIYGPGDAKKGSRNTQIKVAKGKFPFYTGGGANVIHIEDVIDAMCTAWKVGRTGERYILAGENITVKNLLYTIAECAGVPPPKILLPAPLVLALGRLTELMEKIGMKGPVPYESAVASLMFNWFDNSKARHELNLNPRPAKTAIAESVEWMKKNGVLSAP